ncbi:hypothetical protein [Actinomadura montaniterrae]|uniref:Uncharacterized protein n=1 Tax=Actinomadura montaniterrae TaxID=1803903 RepID=A0A6L3VLN1_9ACTN|nr:hypothetical protein [Actinomadura montaniterrae]KAB2370877.1 hypothetical protein F9B16_33950 [Actinomadura montaniterrae]
MAPRFASPHPQLGFFVCPQAGGLACELPGRLVVVLAVGFALGAADADRAGAATDPGCEVAEGALGDAPDGTVRGRWLDAPP